MRRLVFAGLVLGLLLFGITQIPVMNGHRAEKIVFKSDALQGNKAGEEPMRDVLVYLPKDYQSSGKRYPVLYFLHGFGVDQSDYYQMAIDHLMDSAIAQHVTLPFIVVVPNGSNQFKGSFYVNSEINGRWSDYIGHDLVQYIDANYRTIPSKDSRGICGHSMGGQGALRVAMLYPEVFGSIYAMSPSILNWGKDFYPGHPGFRNAIKSQNMETLSEDLYALAFVAMGRVFSADENKRPFGARLPLKVSKGHFSSDSLVIKQWEQYFVNNMLERYSEGFRHLNGLAIDWGKQDSYLHIPSSCKELCRKLEIMQIPYQKEEYEGGHYDKIPGMNGRFYQKVIPFFSSHLAF